MRGFRRIDWFEVALDAFAVVLALLSLVFLALTIYEFVPTGTGRWGFSGFLILPISSIAFGGAAWGMLKPRVAPKVRAWRRRRAEDRSRPER